MAKQKGILSEIARGGLYGLQKAAKGLGETATSATVSYTHLTLPTIE
mgnify:CR=1 FL=1